MYVERHGSLDESESGCILVISVSHPEVIPSIFDDTRDGADTQSGGVDRTGEAVGDAPLFVTSLGARRPEEEALARGQTFKSSVVDLAGQIEECSLVGSIN